MAWYDEAIFYHIYPLGLTGAPKTNSYGEVEHRLNTLIPWISHIREIGCNALYIGPLFESVGHGYETTDYKKLDSRLGTNQDLTDFVEECHRQGIRVILDGVFNHTGRDFFAFQDIKRNREHSQYKDWYCRVNFYGNNEYHDGFSYENWGGYDLLVKLNQNNPAVRDYICDVIRFWAREFQIDGIRLDAADVLDFGYMQALRRTANEIGPDFWLMGEVIHGDYTRWVNEGTLHSVTNYHLHKALYSGHNDHNYFEIAHTVKRLYEMGGNRPDGLKLYNFVDNHDVERIYTKLNNKHHFMPVHILMYTLPGVPSIYYGSEFGIEGRKERYSDDSIRPALNLSDYHDALGNNWCTRLICALGRIRQQVKALSYGDYKELTLTNRQYAFSRNYDGKSVIIAVNNDDQEAVLNLPAAGEGQYVDLLSGERTAVSGGRIRVRMNGNSGGIWVLAGSQPEFQGSMARPESIRKDSGGKAETQPGSMERQNEERPVSSGQEAEVSKERLVPSGQEAEASKERPASSGRELEASREQHEEKEQYRVKEQQGVKDQPQQGQNPLKKTESGAQHSQKLQENQGNQGKADGNPNGTTKAAEPKQGLKETPKRPKTYEEMSIEELQEAVLEKLGKNGPITDRMLREVRENVYHNSLINWVKSFR